MKEGIVFKDLFLLKLNAFQNLDGFEEVLNIISK